MTYENGAKPFLYLPIEVKAREYKSKLLFSCIAAREGFNIVLGNRKRLQALLSDLPRGIFIEKGLESPGKARAISSYIKKGHKVVAWDEEGLFFITGDIYKKNRVNIKAFEMLEVFFAWGDEQKRFILEKLEAHNLDESIVKVTGNPRVDIINTEFKRVFARDSRVLREKYGPFILINSNFTIVNPFIGKEQLKKNLEEWGYLETEEGKNKFAEIEANILDIYKHFIEMLPLLSTNFNDHKIIVRPHPAESHESWQEAASKLSNVMVINDGDNVLPWIMAADALIHNRCTTGIESYLLGKISIAYCPIKAREFVDNLPNQLSTKVHSLDELVAVLQRIINGEAPLKSEESMMQQGVAKYIYNVNGSLASELIIEELKKIDISPQRFSMTSYYFKRYLRIILQPAKRLVKKLLTGQAGSYVNESYIKHKFQDLTEGEIKADIAELAAVDPSLKSINVKALGDQCFYLSGN